MTRPAHGHQTYPRAIVSAIAGSVLCGLLFGTAAYLGVGWLVAHRAAPPTGHYLAVGPPWWALCALAASVGMVAQLPRCLWATHRRRGI